MPYLTLAAPGHAETRVLGSRFIALALPVDGEAAARAALDVRQREMFDATHHCSAWRLRDGAWRANDAGEPGGSAGMPILAAIDGAGLADCAVIVTRYYGGTKLGVGGLVRAYGEAAALALTDAPRREGVEAVRVRVRYGYEHTSAVMRAVERGGAVEVEHGFAPEGSGGELELTLPLERVGELEAALRERTGDRAIVERIGQRVVFRRPEAG